MVDRSDEPRLITPIVPDPGSEIVTRNRTAQAPRARTWPLWLLCLLLIAGLAAMAGFYWLDRQAWQASQREIEGQLSNLHARFDSLDDRQNVDSVEEQLDTLSAIQQTLQARQEELAGTLQGLEERSADDSSLDRLAQALDAVEEERDTLAATIDAMQRSLDVLERSGEEAHAAIEARLEVIEADQEENEQHLQVLDTTDSELEATLRGLSDTNEALRTQVSQLEEAYTQLQSQVQALPGSVDGEELADIKARLDQLASNIEALQEDSEAQARWEQVASRVGSNQAGLIELRQNQLSLSASVESLDSRMERTQGASPQQLRELEERMESLETSRRQLTGRVADLLSEVGDLQRRVGQR